MFWCFAKVNNRVAEIYFEERKSGIKILGHCYVKPEKYKTKREQKWIDDDTPKFQFIYRNKKYRRI